MRRAIITFVAAATFAAFAASAHAQQQGQTRQERTEEATREEEARQRRLNREFQRDQLPLPELANSGPCPYVKVLYDAARNIEFEGAQAPSAVAWSGEIQGVSATCRYQEGEPIVVDVITTFHVGRGPRGAGEEKSFPYWIAVTDRDRAILGKERFSMTARIPRGQDRVLVYDRVDQIVIPRADAGVSGSNFEVLIGFEVSPEMADFNRQGSRFLINATGQQASATGGAPTQ